MRSELRALALVLLLLGAAAPASAAPLVGPGVGTADALQADGNRLYNRKQFRDAARVFLQATRAAPEHVPTYLSLARSRLKAKEIPGACYAYRVYVRAAAEGEERSKAQSELELCERQLRAGRGQAEESTRQFVEAKAAFFAALEAGNLVGHGSAGEWLAQLVEAGYLGTDLGEMAGKLAAAATTAADDLHRRALAREALDEATLRRGEAFYELAATFGPAPQGHVARSAFLEGLAELRAAARPALEATDTGPGGGDAAFAAVRAVRNGVEGGSGSYAAAIAQLSAAVEAAPAVADYRFFRALAIWRSGDEAGALAALERDLPDDPRTAVLRAVVAMEAGNAAAEVERVLFSTRYPAGK